MERPYLGALTEPELILTGLHLLQVTVCGSTQRFVAVGLRPCQLNMSAPGVVNITFTVVSSAMLSTSLTRALRILSTCLPGQVQCNSGTCSDGACVHP